MPIREQPATYDKNYREMFAGHTLSPYQRAYAYLLSSGKIDAFHSELSSKIDAGDSRLSEKIDAVANRLSGKIDSLRVWAVTLYIALAATMLGTMARGFGWL
jgi:hypothetical protein